MSSKRLQSDVRPIRVGLDLEVDPSQSDSFRGQVAIAIRLSRAARSLRLHAVELQVTRASVEVRGRRFRGRVVALPAHEMIQVDFDRPLPAGEATLRLKFAGRLRTDFCGLYRVEVDERRYALTQLEVTDARRFFPCFDEPGMKARFRISVTTGSANRVLSNASVERSELLPDGRSRVQFAETPPLSTYLIALAVGHWECSPPVRLGPTEIRLWHVPGKSHLTAFGLETARECLARLERYFGVPYPYDKLDLLAVPNLWAFGMENAGAVFFREDKLLIDPDTATVAERRQAAEVICHELAHMWYGDLVTMAWWDDLWLNESFATWMALTILDEWQPAWHVWNDFQHDRAAAFEIDALRHTHSVYCKVRTPAEAVQNFDHITYNKGASLVRMIERYIGARDFRRGVRLYIRRHREGNAAAADLWRALTEASGQDIGRIARAWIEQKGYPVVEIRRARSKGRVRLQIRQKRFAAAATRAAPGLWPIPWVVRVGRGRGSRIERHLLGRARQEIPLESRAASFLYGNADEVGFFRPSYGADELQSLLGAVSKLTVIERMGFVDHQWALVRAGLSPMGSLLDLADDLREERDPNVLVALQKPLGFLAGSLLPDVSPDLVGPFRGWVGACFEPGFRRLGWEPASGEPDNERRRRAAALALAGSIGRDPAVLEEASARCDAYLSDRHSLDANLADTVVALGASTGDAVRYEQFLKASRAGTPQERRRFLLALADFRQPRLVRATQSLLLTDAAPNQELLALVTRLLANGDARASTWEFLKRRWARVRRRLPDFQARLVIEETSSLLTPEHRRDVAAFFREHPIPSGERTLHQALERFDWYRCFRRSAARGVGEWLAERPTGRMTHSAARPRGNPR